MGCLDCVALRDNRLSIDDNVFSDHHSCFPDGLLSSASDHICCSSASCDDWPNVPVNIDHESTANHRTIHSAATVEVCSCGCRAHTSPRVLCCSGGASVYRNGSECSNHDVRRPNHDVRRPSASHVHAARSICCVPRRWWFRCDGPNPVWRPVEGATSAVPGSHGREPAI